jgi:transposase
MLEAILRLCRERKLIKERGKQRTDSTHVLATIRVLNRLENVGATLRHALNTLAVAAPEWLGAHATPEWIERYGARVEEYRLPKGKDERLTLAELIGADGHKLLEAIYADAGPAWMRQVPAVERLRQVWVQQYYLAENELHWRTAEEHGLAPAAVGIRSPHDPQARYSEKRSTAWIGYKAHLTETCDEDKPRLITEVETTVATVPDHEVVDEVHQKLSAKQLLPADHLLGAGYINELCGPPRRDTAWQAQAGKGFAASDFTFDWEKQQATCPDGKQSSSW